MRTNRIVKMARELERLVKADDPFADNADEQKVGRMGKLIWGRKTKYPLVIKRNHLLNAKNHIPLLEESGGFEGSKLVGVAHTPIAIIFYFLTPVQEVKVE